MRFLTFSSEKSNVIPVAFLRHASRVAIPPNAQQLPPEPWFLTEVMYPKSLESYDEGREPEDDGAEKLNKGTAAIGWL